MAPSVNVRNMLRMILLPPYLVVAVCPTRATGDDHAQRRGVTVLEKHHGPGGWVMRADLAERLTAACDHAKSEESFYRKTWTIKYRRRLVSPAYGNRSERRRGDRWPTRNAFGLGRLSVGPQPACCSCSVGICHFGWL